LLLSLLVGLYPSAFFASHNWYGFTPAQIWILIGGSVAMTLIAVWVVAAPLSLALRWQAGRRAMTSADRLNDALWALTGVAACLGLSTHPLAAMSLPHAVIILGAAALALAGAAWAYRSGLGGLNVLLLGLTALTAGQWIISYVDAQPRRAADHWFNARRQLNDQIRFERTPNVYYVLMESYPSRLALKRIFNFEQPQFYGDLERRGFEVHHDAFSNYHSTVSSMASLFAMDHHYLQDAVGNLDSHSARHIISARVYNAVVDIFRRNGYRVEYLHERRNQVRLGADVDYLWPVPSVLPALKEFLAPYWTRNRGASIVRRERLEAFRAAIDARLDTLEETDFPRFTYLYLRTPGHSKNWLSMANVEEAVPALEKYRRGYPADVRTANRELEDLLDRIIASDPGALIVVGGDHGAWAWRVEQRPDGTSVPPEIVALDRLGILLAIRFPGDYDGRYGEEQITNVNLFRYVFAYLADSDEILEEKAADDGYILRETAGSAVQKAVEDGRLLREFVNSVR